jgi:NitT/TauT family transport system substrate-binding protein
MGSMQARHTRRRGALAAAVATTLALALAGCGGDDEAESPAGSGGGSGPEKSTLKVGILKIGDVLPLWIAEQQGFLKEAGFQSVQIVEMAGGAAIQPAIQSGQLDLGWSNVVSVVLAKTRKFDFQFFAGGTFLGPGAERNQVILVKKDSSIRNPEQLAGKTIGFNLLGGINELATRAYLTEKGVDPGKVKMVELGTPQTLGPLAQGRVDAVAANEPQVTIGLENGTARVLIENPFSPFGEEPFLAGWMSTSKWLDQNPKTVEAFSGAIDKAVQWAEQNKEEANRLLSQKTGIDPAVVDKMVPSITKGSIEPAHIQPYIDAAKKFGLSKTTFPPEEVLWQGPEG